MIKDSDESLLPNHRLSGSWYFIVIMLLLTVHNVQFVKYDVTVSFMAQVLDTVTYLVPQVLDTAS